MEGSEAKKRPVLNFRRAKLRGVDVRSKKREADPISGDDDDDSFEVFYTLVPNMLTLTAFAICVHVLANKLTGRSVGSPAWYAVVAAAVATGTAASAIVAIYAYLYGRDLVNWAKGRRGAHRRLQLRRGGLADSEGQRLLTGEQKTYH